ncbi:MAG: tetratricopeptide repeat protein [Acidobacteria bacterium]|nr:tetratricopeptide repeat protein [Acidobacteriota bacterium]
MQKPIVFLALLLSLFCSALPVSAAWQGGFLIFGRVSLPDGQPAARVRVFIETTNGLKRDVLTDQEGNYEFRGMSAGRYRVYATNPDVPEQFSEPAESDTTRSFANRLQINVYLRLPMHSDKKEAKPGTINVAEATQNIPKDARKAYEQGLKFHRENRPQQAMEQFNKAIELFPAYFQALTERGSLLMQHNNLAESELDFVRALQINDKYAPAYRGIGYCQIQQKQFQAAVSNLEKSFVLDPNAPMTLLLLGYANLSLNRYEEARQCFQQALKLGADTAARAHVYLAEIYAHEQKFKEAADSIAAYLKANPNAADAANLRKMEADWRQRSTQKP